MDQRLIVRILLMVPLFAASSWLSLYAKSWGRPVTFLREIYEAFTIYTFFMLLTNILGGERDIIYTTTGRQPLNLIKPLSYLAKNVDISDPQTFLLIKRCIMQYAWLRIIVAIIGVIPNRSVHIFGIVIYNISITIALNALTLFWVCLSTDLAPYRPWPKFLCVKLIVFFSYWQSLGLYLLHAFGLIPDADKIETISGSLLCMECLGFALYHAVAFPYTDYATTKLIGFGRLPILTAARDAFGGRDLLHDFKMTFLAAKYGYRDFDSVEAVLDHPESNSRQARLNAGLRYQNGGRSKYWLPVNSSFASKDQVYHYGTVEPAEDLPVVRDHGAPTSISWESENLEEDEALYIHSRTLFGDYNYPVLTVRESPLYRTIAERERMSLSITES